MTDILRSDLEDAIRRTLPLDDDAEIAAAAGDVQVLFDRCLLLVEVDEGASLADQRRILDRLTPEDFHDGTDIDPAVLARVGMFLRGGQAALFGTDEPPDADRAHQRDRPGAAVARAGAARVGPPAPAVWRPSSYRSAWRISGVTGPDGDRPARYG